MVIKREHNKAAVIYRTLYRYIMILVDIPLRTVCAFINLTLLSRTNFLEDQYRRELNILTGNRVWVMYFLKSYRTFELFVL